MARRSRIFGLSESELSAYVALFQNNPVNGSRLSKNSGIPRTRIYDILRGMKQKGMVMEMGNGHFVPLPPKEFIKRLRNRYESELEELEEMLQDTMETETYDYFWTIYGYADVMAKSKEMIANVKRDLYVCLFPEEARVLDESLKSAEKRGVQVKYVSMGTPQTEFEFQVVHPCSNEIMVEQQGRVFDLVKDKEEILVGQFQKGQEDKSPINWAKNHWFVLAIREGVRHDFFHCLLEKIVDQGLELTDRERHIYEVIKKDAWGKKYPRLL